MRERVAQIAPIYTEKLGRLGWIDAMSPTDSARVDPTRYDWPGVAGLGGFGVDMTGARPSSGSQLGQLRDADAASAQEDLGPFAYTIATTFGAGVGGGLIGFVAGKAKPDPMWRGAIFSASLAGLGNSMAHLRSDKSKAFGAGMMLASLWGLWWSFKPMVAGQYGGA
jgi:hypothetical protein